MVSLSRVMALAPALRLVVPVTFTLSPAAPAAVCVTAPPAVNTKLPASSISPSTIALVSLREMFVPAALTAPPKSLVAAVSVIALPVAVRLVVPVTLTVPAPPSVIDPFAVSERLVAVEVFSNTMAESSVIVTAPVVLKRKVPKFVVSPILSPSVIRFDPPAVNEASIPTDNVVDAASVIVPLVVAAVRLPARGVDIPLRIILPASLEMLILPTDPPVVILKMVSPLTAPVSVKLTSPVTPVEFTIRVPTSIRMVKSVLPV